MCFLGLFHRFGPSLSPVFVTTVTTCTFIRRSQGTTPFQAGDSNLCTRRQIAARKSILSQIFSARGKALWSPQLVKCSFAKYPRAFSWKWAFSHSMSKIPSFGEHSWFWKSTWGLGPRSNLSPTQGGTVNSCTALTHPDSDITHSTVYRSTNDRARRRDGIREINKRLNLKTIKICFEIYAFFTMCGSRKYPYPPHGRDWNFQGGGGVKGPGKSWGGGAVVSISIIFSRPVPLFPYVKHSVCILLTNPQTQTLILLTAQN